MPLKAELEFYLGGYEKNGFFPPCGLSGSRGNGKSIFAKALAAEMQVINKRKGIKDGKKFLMINAIELKNSELFFEKVMPILVAEKDIALFIDEIENLSMQIQSVLLTLLAVGDNFQSEYTTSEGVKHVIDHRQFTFICAASSFAGVHPDLIDRLKNFTVDAYSEDDLAIILQKKLPHMTFEKDALDKLSSCMRGNARRAISRAVDLQVLGVDHFTMKHFNQIKKVLSIYPFGLTRTEIAYLNILKQNGGGTTLTEICAKMSRTKESVMSDLEPVCRAKNLMRTAGPRGRVITQAGRDILAEIEREYI